jgi:glycosyltransferase involved in cell wall biosynthesis
MENKDMRKPRILHSPIVALYQPYLYVKGLRGLGYEADYMVHNFKPESWLARDCDFDLELNGSNGLHPEKTREIEFFLHAVENYDIFHFHSGFGLLHPAYSIWDRLDELKLLKKLGKKIIMSWWGCDLRTEEVDMAYEYSACQECEEEVRQGCRISTEKMKMIERAFRDADVHLSVGDLVSSYKGIEWIDNAIDCDEWRPFEINEMPEKFRLPKTNKVRIYHSFGSSELRGDVKGTRFIIEAVEKLKSEGYGVELIFFDQIPNRDLKYYQAQADVVVDQLRAGWYGSTAMECLSMGKPVITYIRPEVEAIIPHEHPLINANIDNIYYVLKDLLNDRKRIKTTGERSRKYALTHHHYINIAIKLDNIYMKLAR